ncbi:glycoside hydrolase family 5 protein [Enhygromyxa salina]|uniref:Cellulase (Glycosyl hydrolase family 5) n=1 Tax=Enhygromyxa salina TaxID=215803 RepID=A0A2S9YWM9_9BACT|nr:cellulase family glycosylhydrolase [Enhygromyxa salina]PRQ09515.1 Cellulase (glycosyl hydrolase family 5) [Enhygromyxa salina]
MTRPYLLAGWLVLPLLACGGEPAADTDPDASGTDTGDGDGDPGDGDGDPGDGDGDPMPRPGECEVPIEPVIAPHARLQLVGGGELRDALGRDVVMRGLNTGNRNKTPPFVPFPITNDIPLDEFRLAADVFFARMNEWGQDTARLPFSWGALEPARDVWDEQYLDRYEAMVDSAWAHGLRVIIDFHQDVWAENFCGDGFPTWAVADPNAPWHECPDAKWGLKYVSDPDVRGSFDRFWANEDQLIDEFHEMWLEMADRFADHPGVVALEVLNEPGWGTSNDVQQWKQDVLTPFHDEIIPVMHDAAPDLLIAFDNPGVDAVGLYPELFHPRPLGDYLIYGPHIYGASNYGPDQPDPGVLIFEFADHGRTEDMHVLLGEFGFQPGEQDGPAWLTDVAESLDLERISATMWEYSHNEQLWNYENFSMIDAAGNERIMLDAWVRPWLRAVSGQAPYFEWDAARGVGYSSWNSDGGVTEIVLPRRLFGADGPSVIEVGGDGACFTLDMARGELRVTGQVGAAVTVDLAL